MLLLITGVIVIAIGAYLLSKANGYGKEVRTYINDEHTDLNTRDAKHWQYVETSRSATNMFIYAISIVLVCVAMVVLYFV